MKLNNKKFIIIWIIFMSLNYINSQDIDFGIFNYKGSRLKNIKRYNNEKNKINLTQEVIYTYDNEGYLIGRNLFGYTSLKQKYPIYESKIEYSEDKKKVKETFIKKFKDKGKWILEEDIFEYQYNDKMQLIKVFREENKGEMGLDLDFEYNEAGDIISSKNISFSYPFFPQDGLPLLLAKDGKTIFKYEYLEGKKIRYLLYKNKYYRVNEFIYNDKKLDKISSYHVPDDRFDDEMIFKYMNGNVIETVRNSFFPDKSERKTEYQYDNKNRIITRTEYFLSTVANNKIYQKEEYYYEDGNYIHYPYLLPTKIKVYFTLDERFIDKDIF